MEIRSNSFDASRQPPLSADITRPIRDSIERGTPEPADAEDVRAQVARNKAELAARMEAAAKQLAGERAKGAREKHAERLANARTKANDSAPVAQAADVVDIRPEAASVSQAERAQNARESMLADRAQHVRDSMHLVSERAENARAVQHRAEAAREVHGDRAEQARDKVSLSDTGLRLRAHAARDEREDAVRAERVDELRTLHRQGRLNTDELIARAAYHLLSGE
jgi:hypothetical protein